MDPAAAHRKIPDPDARKQCVSIEKLLAETWKKDAPA
jgi:hypothetical protein